MAYNNYNEEYTEPVVQKPKKLLYTTEIINSIRQDMLNGYSVDTTPFFPMNTDLRAANVVFKMTDEEYEEYCKCFNDAEYFIEKYCKFLTDSGRRTVKLRDFQKDIINMYSSQHLDEEINEMVPDNNRTILLCSRQTGKCFVPTTKVNTKFRQCETFDFFKPKSLISKFKISLLKLYSKCESINSKEIIGKLIELVEKIEYKNHKVYDDKFIDEIDIDTELLSDNGFVKSNKLYITKPFTVYEVIMSDGTRIECADKHILFDRNLKEVFVKDLRRGDYLYSKTGKAVFVKRIIKHGYKLTMCDFSVDSPYHRYYTNNLLSHNTTTTAAFMTWYVCFHSDRNVGIMANKQDTAIEIVDKTKQMILCLPYFLQPGVESWGKTGCAFDNGCKIISSATTKSASIGYTLNGILYLDEFAHIEPSICDNFWRSVYPTLSSSKTAQLIISSTPNGVDNRYAKIWFGSKNGENSFKNLRVDYWQVPGHDEAWAAQQIKDFGEEFFNQEFLLQFSSASSALLRGKDFELLQRLQKKFVPKYIIKDGVYLDDENITWHPDFDPNDIKPEDRFLFILDTAEGNGDLQQLAKENKKSPDANTIQIFKIVHNSPANMNRFKENGLKIKDAYRFIQVGKYSRNDKDEVYMANVCAELALDLFDALHNDNVRIMLEMNYNGKSALNAIMNHPAFFDDLVVKTHHTAPIPGEKPTPKKYGFLTTQTKTNFCKKGKELFMQRKIITLDTETNDQLKSFGWVNGKLKGVATHDDLSFPAVHHIARFLSEDSAEEWLETLFYTSPVDEWRREVSKLLQVYAPDEDFLTEEEFNNMYGSLEKMPGTDGGSGLFNGINQLSPYGGGYQGGLGGFEETPLSWMK